MQRTICIATAVLIIDTIAVADVEAFLGAIPPDGVLHEAGKDRRQRRIESARIDAFRGGRNDIGTAAGPVARRPIGMARPEPVQDPGAVQKVVHLMTRTA
jgi:hypothetical protein